MKIAERILQIDTRIKHVAAVETHEPYEISEDFSQPRFKGALSKEELLNVHKTDAPSLVSLANKHAEATGWAVYGIIHHGKLDTIFCNHRGNKVIVLDRNKSWYKTHRHGSARNRSRLIESYSENHLYYYPRNGLS